MSKTTDERNREFQRLVPLWPGEISDKSLAGRLRLLNRLRSALRRQRCLGLAGHWSYDLARHRQLLEAYRREVMAVRQQGQELGSHAQKKPAGT